MLLAAIIVALLWCVIRFRCSARWKLEAEMEHAARKGYPPTLEALADSYRPIPAQGNGAEWIAAAGEILDDMPSWDAVLPDPCWPALDAPMAEQTRETMHEVLTCGRKALTLAHEAAKRQQARYAVDLLAPYDTPSPHQPVIRRLASLLSLEAVFAAEDGDADRAAKALVTMAWLARSLNKEPTARSLIVQAGIEHLIYTRLPRVLSRAPLTDSHLKTLAAALRDAEITREVLIQKLAALRLIEARQSEVIQRSQGSAEDQIVTSDAEVTRARAWSAAIDFGASATPAQMMAASRQGIHREAGIYFRLYVVSLARQRVALVAVAVKRYALANHQWPPSLDAMAVAAPDLDVTDPFTGRIMEYHQRPEEALIRCQGRDSSSAEPSADVGVVTIRVCR